MSSEPELRKVPREEMSRDEFFLYESIGLLKSTNELYAFFRDLCTPQELKSMSERWSIAMQLGLEEKSYREVQKNTGAGMSTITRVGRFLKNENYKGYQLILSRIEETLIESK